MLTKVALVFVPFVVNIVPGNFYCASRPDVCPKHGGELENCCEHPITHFPMIESRISDQRPYKYRYSDDDSTEETEDFHDTTFPAHFFDKSEEKLPTALLAKQKNIHMDVLKDDEVDVSEEPVVGNLSEKPLQQKAIVKAAYLPDVQATPQAGVGASESVLDIPPSGVIPMMPVETEEDFGNGAENMFVGKAPDVVVEDVIVTSPQDNIKMEMISSVDLMEDVLETTTAPTRAKTNAIEKAPQIDEVETNRGKDSEKRKERHEKTKEAREERKRSKKRHVAQGQQ